MTEIMKLKLLVDIKHALTIQRLETANVRLLGNFYGQRKY